MKFYYYFLKKVLCMLSLLSVVQISAQKNVILEIDSIQSEISKMEWNFGNYKEGILLQKRIIIKSRKNKYQKGEISGYLGLANALGAISRNEESLNYLEIAKKKLKNYHDEALKSKLHFLYGTNYYKLGLHKQAIKSFDNSLDFAYKIPDRKISEKYKYKVYDWKRSSFSFLNEMDSVYSNERKCMQSPTPMLFITIANRHLEKNEIDSAEYYIDKANELVLAKKAPIEGKANVLRAYGKLYMNKNDYQRALKYLFESLEISKKMQFKKRDLESYQLIYESYKGLKDSNKESEYQIKYLVLKDSLNNIERKLLNYPIENILNDNAEETKKQKDNYYYFIFLLFSVSSFTIWLLFKKFKRKQIEANILINQKTDETDALKKKMNKVYEEIVDLAINNDPSFIIKFKEVYSEFYNGLRIEYPQLTVNDMKFFALIKLKFSNKQIAEYAHMSIRTVESKKYRLRKKIELPAETDFNSWVLQR